MEGEASDWVKCGGKHRSEVSRGKGRGCLEPLGSAMAHPVMVCLNDADVIFR